MKVLLVLLLATAAFAQEPVDDSEISDQAEKGEAFLF